MRETGGRTQRHTEMQTTICGWRSKWKCAGSSLRQQRRQQCHKEIIAIKLLKDLDCPHRGQGNPGSTGRRTTGRGRRMRARPDRSLAEARRNASTSWRARRRSVPISVLGQKTARARAQTGDPQNRLRAAATQASAAHAHLTSTQTYRAPGHLAQGGRTRTCARTQECSTVVLVTFVTVLSRTKLQI